MSTIIREFRLTFIWAGIRLDPTLPDRRFTNRADYENLFAQLQTEAQDEKFCLPWPAERPEAHRYWVRYLAIYDPTWLKGNAAWSKGVPLRAKNGLTGLGADWFAKPSRIVSEHYFYPFGQTLVVTFYGIGEFSPEIWLTLAASVQTNLFNVRFDRVPASDATAESKSKPKAAPAPIYEPRPYTLQQFATAALRRFDTSYFGQSDNPAVSNDPFTILTVIRGEGVDPKVAPIDGGDIHRWLLGAAALLKNWDTADLGQFPLSKRRLQIRSGASPGDSVFATRRGRAVWTPSSFTKEPGGCSQSCYHRNQVLAAMQVESLSQFAVEFARMLPRTTSPSARLDSLGEIAARQLVNIYKGQSDTYRSTSLQRQIDDRGNRADINVLCQRYGLSPLPALP